MCPCRKASYRNTFWLMWKLPNNAEHCMYKMCFFLLRWKNRCWLTWRLQSVSSSLSRTRRRTSRFIFFGGKWKCLQVKVKVSPTSASLSRTRRRTSPFIFSGESDCWVHVNGKWWHFWQFLTTSTTTVALNEMSILVMFISGSMHTWGLFQSLCLPVELHAYGLMALSVRWDVSLPHWNKKITLRQP